MTALRACPFLGSLDSVFVGPGMKYFILLKGWPFLAGYWENG
ncbi:MAG: hypothetical protein WBB19_15730 [Desulforhopalus sp.]